MYINADYNILLYGDLNKKNSLIQQTYLPKISIFFEWNVYQETLGDDFKLTTMVIVYRLT